MKGELKAKKNLFFFQRPFYRKIPRNRISGPKQERHEKIKLEN